MTKVGERVRDGVEKQHPITDKDVEATKQAVREQWELEQKTKREYRSKEDLSKQKQKDIETPDKDPMYPILAKTNQDYDTDEAPALQKKLLFAGWRLAWVLEQVLH